MLSFSGSLKVFIALDPCDMRAGVNTLHVLVMDKLGEDTRSGALFVFSNERRSLLKVLYWDGTGLWLMTKRLPTETNQTVHRLTPKNWAADQAAARQMMAQAAVVAL